MTAFAPLGSGDRPARLVREGAPVLLENSTILDLAATRTCSPAQIILAWQMQRGVSVIPKSSNPTRLKQNFAAANIDLSKDEMDQMASLDKAYRFIDGTVWTIPGSPYTLKSLWDE